ncbi:MAG: nitroreductase family protein [Acidobacteria bacterium]|nr:MAG: nitroreductase family protein [Acidobacteriota bacterium]
MDAPRFVPLEFLERPLAEMRRRAREFAEEIGRRRTVREFDSRPVPREIIEDCLRAAGAAPSGANLQPWHFVAISDPEVKRRIREAAEKEERAFYERRASESWLRDLAPLGTTPDKPFLETAPWLIAVFYERFRKTGDGTRKAYYAVESVGLATGFLIAALHHAGLATLTHTPSPMGFLNEITGRPDNERPFLLLVVGYPAPGAKVPAIRRKSLEEIATFL